MRNEDNELSSKPQNRTLTVEFVHVSIQDEPALTNVQFCLPVLPQTKLQRDRLSVVVPHIVISTNDDMWEPVILRGENTLYSIIYCCANDEIIAGE